MDFKQRIHEAGLDEYVNRAEEIIKILDRMGVRDYCRDNCHNSPEGCCGIIGCYSGRVNKRFNVPKRFLELQKHEARNNGWIPNSNGGKCIYHNETGCKLTVLKPAICLGYLCYGLMEHLKKRYSIMPLFLETMGEFSDSGFGDDKLNKKMDEVIRLGNIAIENEL